MTAAWLITAAIAAGFVADLIFGDPYCIPHPVVIIGKFISFLEKKLLKEGDSDKKKFRRGLLLTVIVVITVLAVTTGVTIGAWLIHPWVFFAVEAWWCWQILAARSLAKECRNVYNCLKGLKPIVKDDRLGIGADDDERLEYGRIAVGRIIGRDTSALTKQEVIRGTIETVAENYSDGVAAPLFYMCIGGAVTGMGYKAVNTMDSMIGYKSDRYLFFGRAAAKLDDFVNLLPARIAAMLFILAAGMTGNDMKGAFRIWKRDRKKHASPNAAQLESACAGALGVELVGPAYYFGKYYDKPRIGDDLRPVTEEDILRSIKMMYTASVLAFIIMTGVRIGLMYLIAWAAGAL